jgi:hypothetical protein
MRPYGQVLAPDDSALRIDRFLSDIFWEEKNEDEAKISTTHSHGEEEHRRIPLASGGGFDFVHLTQ